MPSRSGSGRSAFQKPRARNSRFTATSVTQHQADGGEIAETGEIIRAVRIHQRIDLGQFVAGLVMVDDDDGHTELRASASGSMLVVPQSTVTSSVAPLPASARTASTLGP